MVLTMLLLRLQSAIGCLTRDPLSSRGLRLMVLCIPLLTGCGAADDPGNDLSAILAKAGNGNGHAHGSTVSASLTWDPGTDPRVLGYYVHYGTQSTNSVGSCAYADSIYYSLDSLANAASPTAILSGLDSGTTYYFAVSAYNGIESACSNEVSKST
jgi:Fibronectin type III domain